MLVLADDATGALEMGALLAPCSVHLGVAASDGVIDTETRNCGAAAAYWRTRSLLSAEPPAFKKIDSTLRGPIGAELQAILDAFPDHRLLVCPAYPQLGRTVRDSVLLVDGTPVGQTDFAFDPRWPVTHSYIPWGEVHDAETQEDLARIAAMRDDHSIFVGSGGLARCILGEPTVATVPDISGWLVVCGSLHPVSLRQAQVARAAGFDVVSGADAASQAVARRPRGYLVFGGDTAYELFRLLGFSVVTTLGEVSPGVPLSMAGSIPVITKAGGFGTDDLVPAILQRK